MMITSIYVMVTIVLAPAYLVFNKPKSYSGTFSRRLTRSDPEFVDTEILNFDTFNAQWKREIEMESGWMPGKCYRCLQLE